MVEALYKLLLEVPQAVANMAEWLTTPISAKYLNISPLGLFGIGGTSVIIAIIVIHIVKLFI